jgi:hemerythrin superfamily protein
MADASRRLADDHLAISQVLNELKTALENGEVETSHAKLDLFWARLAVHIRAEHLHLFPAVVAESRDTFVNNPSLPDRNQIEVAVERLLDDHEFFMRELAAAIQIVRSLGKSSDTRIDLEGLKNIQNTVTQIEKRLEIHNELEENEVYLWVGTVLSETKQSELATKVAQELANRPPRFSTEAWQSS